jgi:type II secretory pathway pseudopilin PulG
MLLAVIFLMFLLLLSLTIAAPKMARQIQRDREVETMHRGKQYIRAIQLYYHKFKAYPPTVDALVNTNGIRFLRKRYIDPITGKDDWKPVLFGQNKAPTAMGFFGRPLTGTTIAGIGPSGGSGVTGLSGSSGSSSIFGSGSTGSDSSGSGSGSASGPTGSSGPSGPTGTTGTTGSTTGKTFGGAGIIGFTPNSPKQSILIYKTKTKYDEWEFVYDPIIEQKTVQGGNLNNSAPTGPSGPSGPAGPSNSSQ